jgi:hypothetical protein
MCAHASLEGEGRLRDSFRNFSFIGSHGWML